MEFGIISIMSLKNLIEEYPKTAMSIFIGMEGSVWLHLIKDKDPLPIKWQ